MLAVLAEINCLDYLNDKGIYPDEFFTDFGMFKNRCVAYKDATLVVILAGICKFNKRLVTEFIKSQVKRAQNHADKGIKKVIVLSDTMLPTLDEYYKFENRLENFYKCKGWNKAKVTTDVWADIDTVQTQGVHEIALYLDNYDKGDTTVYRKKSEVIRNEKDNNEDALLKLIKVPNVRQLIESTRT